MDRSPLQRKLWYDPTKAISRNITTHTLKNGYYHKNVSNIKFNAEQPDMSNAKNCTAALTDYLYVYPWITISCDTLYNVSYVCQINKLIDNQQGKAPNNSISSDKKCGPQWFMLDKSDQCFLLRDEKRELSYNNAQSICSAKNASVFKVDVAHDISDRVYTENYLLTRILNSLKTSVKYTSREKQYYTLFGSPLSSDSPQSQLPDIILQLKHFPASIFFVELNGECNVLQLSPESMEASSEPVTSLLKGWGVKCRYCSEPVNVSAIICEKPSELYKSQCQTNHFTCQDETCILVIYRCDSVYDCFDGSDEGNCNYSETGNFNNLINVPCILGDFDTHTDMCIMQIHALCDGLYFNGTFILEEIVCYKYRINHIHLSSLLTNSVNKVRVAEPKNLNYLAWSYIKERARCAATNLANKNHFNNDTSPLSRGKENIIEVYLLCKVSYHRNRPFLGDPQRICQNIACPEMFKCSNHYCIYMSAVCDGQYDCVEGDDEILCPLSSCPGLLKCRGEKRCVSNKEICDSHIDCLYSMDDEADCHICPSNCDCIGLSVQCTLNNSLDLLKTSGIDHIKGIILNGVQRQFFVHHLKFHGLVYLNISYCGIENINFVKTILLLNYYIIIADFQSNYLTTTHFFKANIFKNLVYLELSNNNLYVINFGKHFFLTKLVVLALRGNPLREIVINMFSFRSDLQLVDIQYITVYADLKIKFSLTYHKQITIKVSESIVCCVLKSIRCSSTIEKRICFGLLYSLVSKIVFYCISIMTLFLTVFILARNIKGLHMVHKNTNKKKKYYLIALINHSGAFLLISLYLTSLLVVDTLNMNMFHWRQSTSCVLLKTLIYVSLESVIIFKAGLVLILALQIIYPFKHQCLWLRMMAPILSSIWLAVLSTYFLTLIKQFKVGHMCDSICSIGMCGITGASHILLKITCCIDFIFVTITIFPIEKTYSTMRQYAKTLNMLQTNQSRSARNRSVLFKLAAPIITELPFRMCLFGLAAITISSANDTVYCQYVFLFALPANLICTCLISVRS